MEPPSNAPVAAKTKYKKGEVKVKEDRDSKMEGREDAWFATSLVTMQGNVQIEGTYLMIMITIIPGQQQQSKEWQTQQQREKECFRYSTWKSSSF